MRFLSTVRTWVTGEVGLHLNVETAQNVCRGKTDWTVLHLDMIAPCCLAGFKGKKQPKKICWFNRKHFLVLYFFPRMPRMCCKITSHFVPNWATSKEKKYQNIPLKRNNSLFLNEDWHRIVSTFRIRIKTGMFVDKTLLLLAFQSLQSQAAQFFFTLFFFFFWLLFHTNTTTFSRQQWWKHSLNRALRVCGCIN